MTKYLTGCVAVGALAVAAFAAGPASQATVLTFNLDTEFSGATPPVGGTPWVVATFDDGGGTGTVTLTIETSGLSGSEKLTSFYFNIDPAFDALLVSFANQDTTDASFSVFTRGTDCCKADGDGWFDLQFDFPNNGAGAFTANETWSIDLTLAGITAGDFEFLSTGEGNSPDGLYVAAHIQAIAGANCGTADPNCESGWITGGPVPPPPPRINVPEPASLLLFGAGLIGLAAVRRRRKA